MTQAADAYTLLRRIRMDLSDLQAKVTSLTNVLNELNLQDVPRPACYCGLTFKTTAMLDEHTYHAHDGAVPPHWLSAEQRSAEYVPTPQPPTLERT